MTTEPNELAASINHERMPVLLSSYNDFDQWMNGTPDEAFELVRPYPVEAMQIMQSGFEKRDLLVKGSTVFPMQDRPKWPG